MRDICKKYANEIDKDINSLLFLYEGNQINFESSFNSQANHKDKINNEMKIFVCQKSKKKLN